MNYFRLKTLEKSKNLINRLIKDNFEVGYHFEEPAIIIKKLPSTSNINNYMNDITRLFDKNINNFKNSFNLNECSICSHGDWINRKLKFTNNFFINQKIKKKHNILFEAYELKGKCDIYISDVAPLGRKWANDISLNDAFKKYQIIYFLTHERNWFLNRWANSLENMDRLKEGLIYILKNKLLSKIVNSFLIEM